MKHLYFLLFITISVSLNAQETFFVTYNQQSNEYPETLIHNGDQGYIIAGSSDEERSKMQFIKRVDLDGLEIWNKYIDSSYNGWGDNICLDNDENIIILLDEDIQDTSYITIKKIDQAGTELLSMNITRGHSSGLTKVNDGFLVTGDIWHSNNSVIIMLDNDLNVVWDKRYYPTTTNSQRTTALKSLELNDNFYILGEYSNNPGYFDDHKSYILKLDQDGDSIWTKQFDTYYWQCFTSIISNSNNKIIIQGYLDKDIELTYESSIVCLNQDGVIEWESEISNEYEFLTGTDIEECSDGGYISSGGTGSHTGQRYIILYKTSANGETLWTKVIERSARDFASNLLITENNIICTGSTYMPDSKGFDNVFLMQTDLEGNLNGIGSIQSSTKSLCIAPNPASEFCNIELNDATAEDITINIYDLSGRKVFNSSRSANNKQKINVTNFNPGIYTIQITLKNKIYSEKLIVK